jgi:polyisoprenoid-binding protein YceI
MTPGWTFDATDGSLQVRTGVDGVAARMGHRLTIVIQTWQAEVTWRDDAPAAVSVTVDVGSLTVDHGEGGVTPLSAPERAVVRSNALKSLSANRFPEITYAADQIVATDAGFQLSGPLDIAGRRRDHIVDVAVADRGDLWDLSSLVQVRQSDFGIKPYSLMLGSLRVADVVTVVFSASARGSHR